MPSAEDQIRDYLTSLSAKPAARKRVVDREAVKALTAQIKAESDPVNRLRLYAAREEARKGSIPDAVDDSALEAAFVEHAKAWADGEGIPVDAPGRGGACVERARAGAEGGASPVDPSLPRPVRGASPRRAGFSLSGATTAAPRATGGTRQRSAAIPVHEVNRAIDELGSK